MLLPNDLIAPLTAGAAALVGATVGAFLKGAGDYKAWQLDQRFRAYRDFLMSCDAVFNAASALARGDDVAHAEYRRSLLELDKSATVVKFLCSDPLWVHVEDTTAFCFGPLRVAASHEPEDPAWVNAQRVFIANYRAFLIRARQDLATVRFRRTYSGPTLPEVYQYPDEYSEVHAGGPRARDSRDQDE